MSQAITVPHASRVPSSDAVLRGAAVFWFVVAAFGQLAFVYFIASFYGGSTLSGEFADWNRRNLITGHVPGDTAGNLQFAAHVLLAALITAGGLVQLIPAIRRYAPRLHRWNGRVYVATAVVMALGGLALVWIRGTHLTLTGAISISMVAGLILLSAAMALRHARARRIDVHRRWALRLFMVSNAVWFQRVGYMAWIIINQAPVGIGKRMDGWFDVALGFGIFVVPLAVLELYLRARDGRSAALKLATAGLLTVLTLVMAVGIFGTIRIMWWRVL